jgi:hypothetical protein
MLRHIDWPGSGWKKRVERLAPMKTVFDAGSSITASIDSLAD